MKSVILVGQQFAEFGNRDVTMTLPALRSALEQGDLEGEVQLGQGLGHEEVRWLERRLAAEGRQLAYPARGAMAPLALTHKHCEDNVLITMPLRVAPRSYSAQLALNDTVDRLLDHVTGTHISGMVLVEAGRQFAIATGELEFELASRPEPWGFIWTGMELRFSRYAFPVPTGIELVIVDQPGSTAQRPHCTAQVRFLQADQEICSMSMHYDLIPKQTLANLEGKAARRLVQSLTQARASASTSAEAPSYA
jgi:hypothetical protein